VETQISGILTEKRPGAKYHCI